MTGKIAFVFARVCMCAAVASVLAAESSAATCTWTGNAGDHKWSTDRNWDTPPVSGRGDTVILMARSNGVVDLSPIDLDVSGMSVTEIRFGDTSLANGTEPVTLTGNSLQVTMGLGGWKSYAVVSNYAPVVFSASNKMSINFGRSVYFFGSVAASCKEMYYYRNIGDKTGNIYFYGALTAPSATLSSNANTGLYLYGPTQVAVMMSGQGASNFVHLNSTSNDWPLSEVGYFGRIFADVAHSLPTNLVMSWQHDTPNGDNQDQSYKLYGDQVIDRIAGSVPTNSSGVVLTKRNALEAMQASVLTLKSTTNAVSYACCKGALSLVYDPLGDYEQALCDRVNTMTGTLRVKGGTFSSLGANTFASVTRLTVDDGATFRVAASEINGAANPFAGTTDLFVYGAGAVYVAAGVTVTFGRVFVDGMIVPVGRYQALDGTDATATRVAWVKGGGCVSAATVGTSWKKAGSGSWNDADNWSNGVPGRDTPTYFDSTALGPCEAAFATGDTWPKSLELVGDGASVRVASGASVSFDGLDLTSTFALRDGARLVVDGSLAITNWVGTFAVESSVAATSRVEVAGTFAFATKSTSKGKSYPIRVRSGGLLNVAGGEFSGRDAYVPAASMEGGQVMSSGAGKVNFFGIPFSFGSGKSVFAGNSEMRWKLSEAFNVLLQPQAANESLDVLFRDNAKLASDVEIVTATIGGTVDGGRTRVEFASDADHVRLGYLAQVYGSGTGFAELAVSGGRVLFGGRGCDIAAGSNNGVARNGRLTVSGGVVDNRADRWWADNCKKPQGLIVAYGPSTGAGEAGDVYGLVDISGGVVSNKESVLLVGTGANARGEMVVTGGSFVSANASYLVGFGFAGGTGTLTVSNGTFDVAGDMYVGGSYTNVFIEGHPFVNWPVDLHDARGELAVAGGTVKIGGDLVLGADGCGRLVRTGAGGSLAVAGDLVCSNTVQNAESGAELVFEIEGPAAPSPVAVGGSFDVRRGAKAVVRIGDAMERRGRIPLVRASSIAGELSDIAVTVEGGGRLSAEARPYIFNGTFGVCIPRGFMVIVE